MNRLLVVDDEMNIRKVIREYAEFNDFLVDEAADGEQAVEMAYNNDYDIIKQKHTGDIAFCTKRGIRQAFRL